MSRPPDNFHTKYLVHLRIEVVVLDALDDELIDQAAPYSEQFTEAQDASRSLEHYVNRSGDRVVLSVLLNV